ncbi:catalase HPII, partial [Salmonella enterica subsp. enterica serovar Kentucky]
SHEQTQIAPPPVVKGLKIDTAICLYGLPDGDVNGRVVGILLNDKVNAAELLSILLALKAIGVHAIVLYSRMGDVTADDGSTLT